MTPAVVTAARAHADNYGVPLAFLLAVIQVESAGNIFARVAGRDEPFIRWEGHYFDKRLSGEKRALARKRGLAAAKAQGVPNPKGQEARWTKLFRPACEIDAEAAHESISVGVGQVMGTHAERLGFDSAVAMFAYARKGAAEQIDVMLRYCRAFGLLDEMREGDAAGFARGYNGPAYRKFSYDTQIRTAALSWHRKLSDVGEPAAIATEPKRAAIAASMVRMGVEGRRVREVQGLLKRAGYAVEVDGDFGPATKKAVEAFQAANGLEADGKVGPLTWRALEELKVDPGEKPGTPSMTDVVTATPEGRQGVTLGTIATAIEAGKGTVTEATDKLAPIAEVGGLVSSLYTILTVASVGLGLAAVALIAWGWWRSNTTRGVRDA